MALVRGDVGVDGRGDESARLGGDDQRLRPRPLLWFPHWFPLQLDVHVLSLEKETDQDGSATYILGKTEVLATACQFHLWNLVCPPHPLRQA